MFFSRACQVHDPQKVYVILQGKSPNGPTHQHTNTIQRRPAAHLVCPALRNPTALGATRHLPLGARASPEAVAWRSVAESVGRPAQISPRETGGHPGLLVRSGAPGGRGWKCCKNVPQMYPSKEKSKAATLRNIKPTSKHEPRASYPQNSWVLLKAQILPGDPGWIQSTLTSAVVDRFIHLRSPTPWSRWHRLARSPRCPAA